MLLPKRRQRVPAAFDVGVVGGEQADLVAALLDDPAGVLVRVRRDPHLASHVLARAERQLLQPLLVLAERVVRPSPARASSPGSHERALLDDADAAASGNGRARRR